MDNQIKNNVTAIIRTVGERTEQICLHHIAEELPERNIHVIRDLPLKQSTIRLAQIAVEENRPWTLMLGADYIPRIGFIADLFEVSKTASDNIQFIKGTIIDKFLFELRGDVGGPLLQRTNLLKEWLEILPSIQNKSTTEASCQGHFYRKGYKAHRGKTWLALHDYEQHYKDIYRSMFVGGRKHRKYANKLLPRWQELSKTDKDYRVALHAFKKGRQFRGEIEANFTKDYGWAASPFVDWEKEPLTNMNYDVMQFEHLQYLKQKRS